MLEQFPVNRFLLLFSISFISFTHPAPVSNGTSSPPLLLLISFDGFRWDYPDIYNLPHFASLLTRGIKVKHIDNSFATVTFPSHYTIVTGLYEETHGIVANYIYDPVLKAVADMTNMNDTKWWSQNPYSQPIWVSNQLAGDTPQRRSGVIAWPGSSVPINGHRPSKCINFDQTQSLDFIFQQVLRWFREPVETRINFGAVYYREPDATGHRYGPISPETNKTVHECDRHLGQLLQTIDADEYLRTHLNVIVTSDHGMHEVETTHRLILKDHVDLSLFSAYGGRSFVNIFVYNASDIERLYANLSGLPNYEVYKKPHIPEEYHYKFNVRIGDILIVGKVGYNIVVSDPQPFDSVVGDHGYDNRAESMHPIFYAFGPAFRRNVRSEPFRNVDLYPLMSRVLRLPPRATNGSLDNVKHIFIDGQTDSLSKVLVGACYVLVVLTALIFTAYACCRAQQHLLAASNSPPVNYHLLTNDAAMMNGSFDSEDEDDKL